MNNKVSPAPPDQEQRERALDPSRSILVQAPAGSGKTDLLTRRFLRLLSDVDDPRQIVAITFTKAAAAEMRHRIVSELEKAATNIPTDSNELSIDSLARRAYERSQALNWNLIDLPAQLRVSTIDSFCRDLALQQPLLAGLGGALDIAQEPKEHYRRAARRTLEQLEGSGSALDPRLRQAIETLLVWRDNNWQDLETQLVHMLEQRDRWMRDFVIESEQDWGALRARMERPLARAVSNSLGRLADLLNQIPGACSEVMELARFACVQSGNSKHRELAELAEFPSGPFASSEELDDAKKAYECLALFLLTGTGSFRKAINVSLGFPADKKREKQRMTDLIRDLANTEGLPDALASVNTLPPVRYTEEEWKIVQACFTVIRRAAAELQVIFAESGTVDYIEVAQLAQRVLEAPDEAPTDAALVIADGIRHLLVDEFQDTSRRQHKLIASLVAAWPDTSGRTVFVVGDPMQSIYFFRDADSELFPRVRNLGLDLSTGEPLQFEFVPLSSNFRTGPELVRTLNQLFTDVFASPDGSDLQFSPSQPARAQTIGAGSQLSLHLTFIPQVARGSTSDPTAVLEKQATRGDRENALRSQMTEMMSLLGSHLRRMEEARERGDKYRIAILGRTRAALAPIAHALHEAVIPFRAVDLEPLAERPEVLDVLALARALFNGQDRVAWLGVLRAPWCGLSLDDLHQLTSGDSPELLRTAIPELLCQRVHLLSAEGQRAANRVISAVDLANVLRVNAPAASLGTWIMQVWEQLGGTACVDPTANTNLGLLWKCLDGLPNGESDLLGSALPLALETLMAQPDPGASSDCGVQLMTIHKAKGLEFEVVIVPELQARSGRSTARMLTWLERGLPDSDDSAAVTEFLIAPFQPKGADRGKTKEWVDQVYREREHQEIRRILYVAATRAREELHFFIRPEYKAGAGGELILCEPSESLLSAAWPSLREEVQIKFDDWVHRQTMSGSVSLAAAGDSNLTEMAPLMAPIGSPALVRQLPLDYRPPAPETRGANRAIDLVASDINALYRRHEGGMASRALGIAAHAFFEELARLRSYLTWDEARASLTMNTARVASRIRSSGLDYRETKEIVDSAFQLALRASYDPVAEWILSPHKNAQRESRWSGLIAGTLRTVQADAVFRAGETPQSEGDNIWWIVDYKTAQAESVDLEQSLRQLRSIFAPQLEIYAQVLHNLHGADARIHAGLYYPRMTCFDWWKI